MLKIMQQTTSLIPKYNNLVIIGDFNMHIDDITNPET